MPLLRPRAESAAHLSEPLRGRDAIEHGGAAYATVPTDADEKKSPGDAGALHILLLTCANR